MFTTQVEWKELHYAIEIMTSLVFNETLSPTHHFIDIQQLLHLLYHLLLYLLPPFTPFRDSVMHLSINQITDQSLYSQSPYSTPVECLKL